MLYNKGYIHRWFEIFIVRSTKIDSKWHICVRHIQKSYQKLQRRDISMYFFFHFNVLILRTTSYVFIIYILSFYLSTYFYFISPAKIYEKQNCRWRAFGPEHPIDKVAILQYVLWRPQYRYELDNFEVYLSNIL